MESSLNMKIVKGLPSSSNVCIRKSIKHKKMTSIELSDASKEQS